MYKLGQKIGLDLKGQRSHRRFIKDDKGRQHRLYHCGFRFQRSVSERKEKQVQVFYPLLSNLKSLKVTGA